MAVKTLCIDQWVQSQEGGRGRQGGRGRGRGKGREGGREGGGETRIHTYNLDLPG